MIVLNTHAWLWWVSKPSGLSRIAKRRIERESRLGISAISCLEIATLVAKSRISLDRDTLEWLDAALMLPKVELLPLTPPIAVKASLLGNNFPGDPADRIIAATAIIESAPLVTKDGRIRDSEVVTTIW
jgi:PIN domain nuclease of toxin-antitoxin system